MRFQKIITVVFSRCKLTEERKFPLTHWRPSNNPRLLPIDSGIVSLVLSAGILVADSRIVGLVFSGRRFMGNSHIVAFHICGKESKQQIRHGKLHGEMQSRTEYK